ncbi:hypothetical protein MGI18_14055 [Bacillus sp. OVS6]|nr:hypothetical protein MGI18_14055 [Bacillus sp. OVS6]
MLNFINDYKLPVLNIPLIEEAGELDRINDVIDDQKESFQIYIEKFDPNYISIIAKEDYMEHASEGFISSQSEILPNLKLKDLTEFNHDYSADSYVEVEQKLIYHNSDNLFLPLTTNNSSIFSFEGDLFIRDIFVTNFKLDLPHLLLRLYIKSIKVNVINEDIIADVARKNLNNNDLLQIKNAIYQGICFYLFDNLDNASQKDLLLQYIKKYHNLKNKFLREAYKKYLL